MELRALIRQMNLENVLWGAPRIQGELLELGFTVAQLTVAKYMVRRQSSPSGQNWKTFLRNHVPYTAVIDLFVVPTITFAQLYALVIVHLARRWINVTAYPTAVWIAQQITEAFPWVEVPRYLIRDRDAVYGEKVLRRIHSMGIGEFFPTLHETTKKMMDAYSFLCIVQHEHTQLAVIRSACNMTMDQTMAAYSAATRSATTKPLRPMRSTTTMSDDRRTPKRPASGQLSGQCGCEPAATTD
jgi:hypothetical protein